MFQNAKKTFGKKSENMLEHVGTCWNMDTNQQQPLISPLINTELPFIMLKEIVTFNNIIVLLCTFVTSS